MKLARHQTGLTTIMLIVIVSMFGYMAYIGLKLTPVYLDYFSIKSAVDGLAGEMKTRQINRNQYMDMIRKRLDVNYVDLSALKPSRDGCENSKQEIFHFKKGKKGTDIGMAYEKRVPIVANIDFLLVFDYSRTVGSGAE